MKIIPTLPSRRQSLRRQSRSRASLAGNGAPLRVASRKTLAAIGAVWLAFAASATSSGSPAEAAPPPTPAQKSDPVLMRGRYLVENVGLCADCHTPRTEKGQFDRSRWMFGAALPFQPTVPMSWAPAAPPLAGLPSMNEAQAMTFLQTGKRPDGSIARPPMPEYRFDAADAQAVVIYLKSLKVDDGFTASPVTYAKPSK
jgi:mono/diheme cytochrome c family protein